MPWRLLLRQLRSLCLLWRLSGETLVLEFQNLIVLQQLRFPLLSPIESRLLSSLSCLLLMRVLLWRVVAVVVLAALWRLMRMPEETLS